MSHSMKFIMAIMLTLSMQVHAEVQIHYADSRKLSSSNSEINGALREKKILENVVLSFQNIYTLPNVKLKTDACGQSNAFYDPNTRTITLCLELVDLTQRKAALVSRSKQEQARLVGGSILLVLAHEFAHAMVHAYHLPITGREEDFADQLSLYTIHHTKGSKYGISAALLTHNGSGDNVTDLHSLDSQRRVSIICWAWGASPQTYEFVAAKIPAERKSTCAYEYNQIDYALHQLLKDKLK